MQTLVAVGRSYQSMDHWPVVADGQDWLVAEGESKGTTVAEPGRWLCPALANYRYVIGHARIFFGWEIIKWLLVLLAEWRGMLDFIGVNPPMCAFSYLC